MTPVETVPRSCSIASALEVVGERWTLLVLREIHYGVHRFDAIQRNIGAPRDVLAKRLNRLVEAGLLERRQYSERPPAVRVPPNSSRLRATPGAVLAQRLGCTLDAGPSSNRGHLHPRLRA
jgi:HxlR-like helix-turn-helix